MELNSKTIVDLDKELDVIQAKFKSECPSEKLSSYESQLEKILDSVVKKIQQTRTNKFGRDQRDYQQKLVYFWRKPTVDNPVSITSGSSVSDMSDSNLSSLSMRPGRQVHRGMTSPSVKNRNYKLFDRPHGSNNKVINLSNHQLSPVDLALLERGFTFSPAARFDVFSAVKDLDLCARSMIFRRHFFDPNINILFPTEEEQTALRELEELAIEHNSTEGVSLA
ncbi:uncharacterized protein ACNLHF_008578 [Anomaloglossus baeobatrachus]|uniref:uncharacterized protein LOC142292352 n=1 Tax=Anomaloglossus baeobatrachus TaxID=238106 RepID=UPI003F504E71